MKIKKIIFSCAAVSLVFLFSGCNINKSSADNNINPSPAQNQDISKRFQASESANPTPVDSAIKLAQEHAVLSEKLAQVQSKNHELLADNEKLKERLTAIEPELTQTKKELDEANKLLIDMRIELNNWKTDVLGFRDEIRQADKAQLETLLKILEVLGGEIDSQKVPDVNS